jgi:FkbM family methyltransferase
MMLVRRFAYYLHSIFTLLVSIRNWPLTIALFTGLYIQTPFIIYLRRTGLRFKVRSAMDVWVIKETCLDRFYEKVSVPIQDGWNIIDIGAGLGDFSVYAAQCNPHGTIHAYEPWPDSFNLFQQNLRLNGIENVVAFAEAVGPDTKRLNLYGTDGRPLQYSTVPSKIKKASMKVSAIPLKETLSRLPNGQCDLLKLDCEGAEYEILLHANEDCWRHIKRIVLEYHDGVASFSHQALLVHFEHRGFQVRCFQSKVKRDLGSIFITLDKKIS